MSEALVELTIARPPILILDAQQAASFAEQFVVDNQLTAEVASAEIASIKAQWQALEDQRVKLKAGALQACRDIDAFFRPALAYLEAAEQTHKRKIGHFLQKEEIARQAAQAKAREAARAEQERLAKEAIERENKAKALEIRLLAEAMVLQKAGNEAAAHDLVAQADSAALAGAQEAAEKRVEAQRAGSMQLEVPETQKIAGIATRYAYEPEYVDLMMTVQAVANGQAPLSVLTWNTKVCGKMVDGLKEETKIPGVNVKRVPIIASHKRT